MKVNLRQSIAFVFFLIDAFLAASLYQVMPSNIAVHWDLQGNVAGSLSRFWGLAIMPLAMLVIFLSFKYLTEMDPLKNNIEKVRTHMDNFLILIMAFLMTIHLFVILWNLEVVVNITPTLAIGMGFINYFLGLICDDVEKNWMVGIRTPWTLSNDKIWAKTNKLGGRLYKAAGIITFFAIFVSKYDTLFLVGPMLAVTIYLFGYSYMEYQKGQNQPQ